MIGRLYSVVIDCPEPEALARFYEELLGLSRQSTKSEWVVIGDDTTRVAFQQAPDLREPRWPDPERPQQFHIDVMVDDVDAARRRRWRWVRGGCRGRVTTSASTPTPPVTPSAWSGSSSRRGLRQATQPVACSCRTARQVLASIVPALRENAASRKRNGSDRSRKLLCVALWSHALVGIST
jgi:hypothetical protein